jgi:regulator of RNase E activity RraA
VELSGVRVQSGDLLHGDASGVTTIPLPIADKVYGECLKLGEREAALRDYAHSRDFTLEGLKAKLLGK